MEKVWEIKNPEEYLKPRERKQPARETTTRLDLKNPARAYTLSLFFWGVGQNYNDERGKGLLFQLAMIGLFVSIVLSVVFGDSVLDFLRSHQIGASQSFLVAELLFLCLLIFWLSIAGDAYHSAAKTRRTRFSGIQNHIYPCICSLLVPGWGQFLNGQPIKGSIFSGVSVFGIFAIVSIPATLLIWSRLDTSDTRLIVETVFAITVLYAPIVPFIWLFSGYDALKVSLDDLKKESLWERIKSANNRRRTQGWIDGVFPSFKSTILLILFLVGLSIVISRTLPLDFYTDLLASGGAYLRNQGMIIVPDIIDRLILVLPVTGN